MPVSLASRRRPGTQLTDGQILRRAVGLVAVCFVVGGALLFGSSLFGSGGPEHAAPPARSPSRLPSRAVTTSSAPSPTPTPSATPTKKKPRPTAAGMEAFLRSYLVTVAGDPAAAWPRLTPAFQRRSGGFPSYQAFWGTVTRATLTDVFADPQGLTVSYGVRYTRADGRTSTDRTQLRLVYHAGRYRIAGEG